MKERCRSNAIIYLRGLLLFFHVIFRARDNQDEYKRKEDKRIEPFEDDHIPSMWGIIETICQLVDNDHVSGIEGGLHADGLDSNPF